jgi:hypothetical protein
MTKTADRTAPKFLGTEFNPFLFAPVGTDRNGGPLSVVSALARLDLDPWTEAANLARLPRAVAAGRLAALLRRFTELPHIASDSGAIAPRLLALLPNQTLPALPTSAIRALAKPGPSARRQRASRSGAAGLGVLLAIAVLCGLQYISQTPHAPDGASANSSLTHGTRPPS